MLASDGRFALADLLRDSVENFHLQQQELPWTAVAYAVYLAPQRKWTNRYGESFTMDDMTNALMAVPLHRATCAGAHQLSALTAIMLADAFLPCLSAGVREALTDYLQQRVRDLVASQHKDGYWTVHWPAGANPQPGSTRNYAPDTQQTRLLATGHLLESLELLPSRLRPPSDVYRRAARWLCTALGQTEPITTLEGFCPCTHALCAIRGLTN
jgi:hypothetical protein